MAMLLSMTIMDFPTAKADGAPEFFHRDRDGCLAGR